MSDVGWLEQAHLISATSEPSESTNRKTGFVQNFRSAASAIASCGLPKILVTNPVLNELMSAGENRERKWEGRALTSFPPILSSPSLSYLFS